jgi:hypothetical protein
MTASRFTDRPAPELIGEYPGVLVVSAWKNVGICTWVSGAVGPAVDTLSAAMPRVMTSERRGSWIHLIRDKAALPDAAARSGFVRMMAEREAELGCVAVVVGGTGFWASAMRNAVIGLRVFAPRKFELRLHGAIDEVIEWLPAAHEKATGVHLSPATLQRLLFEADHYEPGA